MRQSFLFFLLFFTQHISQAALVQYSYQGGDLSLRVPSDSLALPAELTHLSAVITLDDTYFINNTYDFSHCNLNGLQCDQLDGMIDWVISDGVTTYSYNGIYDYMGMTLSVDEAGDVIDYQILLDAYNPLSGDLVFGEHTHLDITGDFSEGTFYCSGTIDVNCDLSDSAFGSVGSWTVTPLAVPVPAAVWLFGSALAGLGWMRRTQTI